MSALSTTRLTVPRVSTQRDRTVSWLATATLFAGLFLNSACIGQTDVIDKPSELTRPTFHNSTTSRVIAEMMEGMHLSKLPLDDTIADRAFTQYVDSLDPLKDYFTQSDIDEFDASKNQIDDKLRKGEFDIALAVFKRFLQRVDQRTELALGMIDADHDFSLDEDLVTDPDLQKFAKTEQETTEKWRKRIKYSLLVLQSNSDEAKRKKEMSSSDSNGDQDADPGDTAPESAKQPDPPEEILRKRYEAFNRRMHQMDTEDVLERYISAVTNSFDPHTSYMSKKTYENFIIMMGLELEGIGATLQGTDDGYTTIKAIVKGGAAAKQGGLEVEDKIYAVGQGNDRGLSLDSKLARKHGTEFVDVTGMKLDDVVAMIRGEAGTTVRLSVVSENGGELHTVSIIREKIKLEDQAARGEVFEEAGKKIGVIELPSFYADMSGNGGGRSTTADVRRIIEGFNRDGVQGLILDLRSNGGGSLSEAIDLTGLFIDVGPVVQVKDLVGRVDRKNDENQGMAWTKPMVVLTSKFSASASEILAGAIQDYQRGLVVGDTTTHGKGTVQTLQNLSELITRTPNVPCKHGALKITMAQFYRPNGDSTQKRGVLSDIVLPSFSDNMEGIAESDLDFPVEFDQVPTASFARLALVTPVMIRSLQYQSSDRLAKSEDFQKLVTKIQKYVEQKKRKTVSLNAEKFLARRKELNAEEEDKNMIEDQLENDDKIERKFYLDEVIKITADYMDMLSKRG